MNSFTVTLNNDILVKNVTKIVFGLNNLTNSSIYFEKENRRVNAKSILGLLSLMVGKGDKITVYYTENGLEDKIKNILLNEY